MKITEINTSVPKMENVSCVQHKSYWKRRVNGVKWCNKYIFKFIRKVRMFTALVMGKAVDVKLYEDLTPQKLECVGYVERRPGKEKGT